MIRPAIATASADDTNSLSIHAEVNTVLADD
jgi:hypothetical protein